MQKAMNQHNEISGSNLIRKEIKERVQNFHNVVGIITFRIGIKVNQNI